MIDFVVDVGLALALARLCVIDIRERRLPDAITLPLTAAGLCHGAWEAAGWPADRILGAAVGFLIFWLLGELFWRWRGVEGLGQGDAKLLAAAGAWLGWEALPLVVLGAALGALAVELARGGAAGRRIAFGPWLALAFWALWIWRAQIGGLLS